MNCQWKISGINGFDIFIHGVYLSHETGIIKKVSSNTAPSLCSCLDYMFQSHYFILMCKYIV